MIDILLEETVMVAEVRDALAEMVEDGVSPASVRTEIRDSWRRSVRAGLRPDQFEVRFDAAFDTDAPVIRAALPVLDDLVEDLSGSIVGVILSDVHGRVIDRRVAQHGLRATLDGIWLAPGFVYAEGQIGTNAIGTALAQQAPSMVVGHEHFADAVTIMACAAVPIVDPESGRLAGVIDLTCPARSASRLMLPLARRAAREIEQRLVDDKGIAERLLLRHFLQRRRGAKGPMVFVNEQRMITNAAADHIVRPADASSLWEHATWALANNGVDGSQLVLSSGAAVTIECEPVLDGGELRGAVLQLRSIATQPTDPAARTSNTTHLGWRILTDTEQSVATLATQGLTNREIGERLFMSRYTVDAHIRSIYRKLDVNSRVALANSAKGTTPSP